MRRWLRETTNALLGKLDLRVSNTRRGEAWVG
jgi:hypothetical protein